MVGSRTPTEALLADAAHAAATTLRAVGLDAEAEDDRVEVQIDDRHVSLKLLPVAYCTGPRARALLRGRSQRAAAALVVADRITADAREVLTDAGWSWLDRRGRLHVRAPGLLVDVDVPASPRSATPVAATPIAGRGGLTVAYWLCARPGEALSPTKSAPQLRLAPSTISTAVRRLVEAGLVDDNGTGIFPELFWELAAVWRPEPTWLLDAPDPARHRSRDPHEPGWRRSGTAAAAAYGAPVASTDGALELYVPGPVVVSIASRTYGVAQPGIGPASVAVAPVSDVVAPVAETLMIDGWEAAPVLAVALDLAQDRARGREILEGWEIDDAVWR